jgi:hypothetical protein
MGFRYYYVQVEKLFLPRFTRKSQSLCLFYGDIISILKKSVSNQFKESILTQLSFIMLSRELYATPRYKTHKKSELTFF